MLYFLLTTGPLSKTPLWNRGLQLTLDAIFIIFWIAAAATSQETCSDLCNACGYHGQNVWSGETQCTCDYKPYALMRRQHQTSSLVSRAGSTSEDEAAASSAFRKAEEIGIRKGMDAALV